MSHLHATKAAGRAFYQNQQQGPMVMLNLLRYRAAADYTATPELQPAGSTLSGREAYACYVQHIRPLLAQAQAEVLYFGTATAFLIGPEAEQWDAILLVRYPNKANFLAFANDPAYAPLAGHRTAAPADSRLLPTWPATL